MLKKKIFKGYSPSGTRRYVAHIENVINMKTKNLRGAEKFFYFLWGGVCARESCP